MSYYPDNDYGQQPPTAPQAPPAPQLPQAPQMGFAPQLPQAPQMGFAPQLQPAPQMGFAPQPLAVPQMSIAPQPFAVPQMNYVPQLAPAPQVIVAPQPAAAPSINIVNTLTAGAQGAQVSTLAKKTSGKRTFILVITLLNIFGEILVLSAVNSKEFAEEARKIPNVSPEQVTVLQGVLNLILILVILDEIFGFIAAWTENICMIVTYIVSMILGDIMLFMIPTVPKGVPIIHLFWIIFWCCFASDVKKQANN